MFTIEINSEYLSLLDVTIQGEPRIWSRVRGRDVLRLGISCS